MATKAKKKPRARKPRAKQGHLDGMAPPSIKPLDDAADNYFEAMQERVTLSKDEKLKKTALIEEMKAQGMDRYVTADGLVVTVTAKSKVMCKKKAAEQNGDGEDDDDDDDEADDKE